MNLTLEVTGPQAAALGPAARKVFTEAGGTIGRLRNNYWVLTDPWVSSHHAVIRFADGVFYIEDTSTNGVFINSPNNRLVPGQPHALRSGDDIFIEPYQIRAVISRADQPAADPFGDLFAAPPARSGPPAPAFSPILPDDVSGLPGDDGNWLDRLGPGPQGPPPKTPSAADLSRGSPASDHYRPPAPIPPAAPPPAAAAEQPIIPSNWLDTSLPGVPRAPQPPAPAPPAAAPPADPVTPVRDVHAPSRRLPADEAQRPATLEEQFLRDLRPREERTPRPQDGPARGDRPRPAPAESREQGALAAVLAGAGLEQVAVTPELAESFGEILRVVVAGVMDILQSRQRIKNEFRMEMTHFKPAQNNPLKFSANVDDALHNLLVKRNPAYLAPVEAFEDAFDDLRNHQVAMLAGVRVAFDAMLAAFDPDVLQQQFDRDLKKGALLNMPGKFRYWDQYCERIRAMVQDPETTFRELFGEEFATAYEEQLARLKTEKHGSKR
jgi:type VI secretion system FHA domain protein